MFAIRLQTVVLAAVALGLAAPAAFAQSQDHSREDFRRPLSIPFPDEAPYHPQIATLGKMLFFDPRLSSAQNMSCATCHNPSFGWEAPVDLAIGASNEPLPRHAQTVANLAWSEHFFWDGRASSLEEQAAGPIVAAVEMNSPIDETLDRLRNVSAYVAWFDRLFPGEGLTERTLLVAIATYERTIVTDWAPFDRWVEGDDDAISASAQRGFEVFVGKAGCAACHSGWNFTDDTFHDIGLYTEDVGRQAISDDGPHSWHAFKTPGLRDIVSRAPYMHNGALPDLDSVIVHYASGGIRRPSLSPLMHPFELTDQEFDDLIAFLESLSGDAVDVPSPRLPTE